jgi:hypothetical protein
MLGPSNLVEDPAYQEEVDDERLAEERELRDSLSDEPFWKNQ